MQRKLNEEFIKEYSAQFSEKITSNFFTDKNEITGKEILKVTPSRQVNFFILKILFGKWQEEMKKLESPYFNYRSAEVRRAMVDFMNTLSQHIEVGGDYFITLAEEAVESTLRLLVDPAGFLEKEFEDKKISSVTAKVTKPVFKYIKLHKSELEAFFNEHEGENIDEFLEEAASHFYDPEASDSLNDELRLLSEIVPINWENLLVSDELSGEENTDFPIDEDEEDVPGPDADDIVDEPEADEPEEESGDQASWDQEVESEGDTFASEEAFDEEDDFEEDDFKEEEREAPASETEEEPDDADKLDFDGEESVNEQYASSPSTLNDKFSSGEEKQTVADQLQKKKVTNIMEAISVNHRYMFTKELFDGDRDAFNTAIEKVEASESFDDAVELLVQDFAREREWDMNSDEVKELLKLVFRKFR